MLPSQWQTWLRKIESRLQRLAPIKPNKHLRLLHLPGWWLISRCCAANDIGPRSGSGVLPLFQFRATIGLVSQLDASFYLVPEPPGRQVDTSASKLFKLWATMADKIRDCYGLRPTNLGFAAVRCAEDTDEDYDRKMERNRQSDRLRKQTRQLKDAMDLNYFITVSLEQLSRHLVGDASDSIPVPGPSRFRSPGEEKDDLVSLERETAEIEKRLSHINLQNTLLRNMLCRISIASLLLANHPLVEQSQATECSVEFPYYRYHRSLSHKSPSQSVRVKNIGILCPGWRKDGSADSKISKSHVQKHLAPYDTSYPPFISVSSSPGRIYNIMISDCRFCTANSATVLIISSRKLEKMGVECFQSTHLVREFGLKTHSSKYPEGVHYATPSHWLVHRWIPEECIEREMAIEEFKNFCRGRGIVKQDSVGLRVDVDVDARPSLEDILESKPNAAKPRGWHVGFADDEIDPQENNAQVKRELSIASTRKDPDVETLVGKLANLEMDAEGTRQSHSDALKQSS